MKNNFQALLSVTFGVITTLLASAQTPSFEWVRTAGATNSGTNTQALDVATDAAGNVIVVGRFDGDAAKFENISVKTSDVGVDGFVAKYTPAGSLLWVRSIDGALDLTNVVADQSGKIFVYCTGSTTWGDDTINFGGKQLVGTGSGVYLGCFDPAGTCLWVKKTAGLFNPKLTVDGSGNVYLSGNGNTFSGVVFSGGDTIKPYQQFENFTVMASYDNSGNYRWGKKYRFDQISALAFGNNRIYLGGNAQRTVVFGNDTLYYSSGLARTYYAAADASGNPLWMKGYVPASQFANADLMNLYVDQLGFLYAVGSMMGLASGSDAMTVGSLTLTKGINIVSEAYVIRFDQDGTAMWAAQSHSRPSPGSEAHGFGVAEDNNANVYVTGAFKQAATFYIDTLIPYGSGPTIFAAKYDPAGRLLWQKKAGSNDKSGWGDVGRSVAAGNDGSAYVVGLYSDTARFDAIVVNPRHDANYTGGIFITRIAGMLGGLEVEHPAAELYPNPAKDRVYLKTGEMISGVVITDMLGRTYAPDFEPGGVINTSQLPPGLYIVTIKTAPGNESQAHLVIWD